MSLLRYDVLLSGKRSQEYVKKNFVGKMTKMLIEYSLKKFYKICLYFSLMLVFLNEQGNAHNEHIKYTYCRF